MTQNIPNIILHCNCTIEVCKFYNLKEQESEIGEEFCWIWKARIKSWIWGSLICWSEGERVRSLSGTCLDLFFLPKKKKCTQVSVRNSRRWGSMGHHSCTGGKKLWKFCLESKEIRKYKGSWFINLAMVERIMKEHKKEAWGERNTILWRNEEIKSKLWSLVACIW